VAACVGTPRMVEVTFDSLQSRGIVPDGSPAYYDSRWMRIVNQRTVKNQTSPEARALQERTNRKNRANDRANTNRARNQTTPFLAY